MKTLTAVSAKLNTYCSELPRGSRQQPSTSEKVSHDNLRTRTTRTHISTNSTDTTTNSTIYVTTRVQKWSQQGSWAPSARNYLQATGYILTGEGWASSSKTTKLQWATKSVYHTIRVNAAQTQSPHIHQNHNGMNLMEVPHHHQQRKASLLRLPTTGRTITLNN